MEGFRAFGVGGETREAFQGSFGTTELEFEFEGALLERGDWAKTVETCLEIGEGRRGLCDQVIGLKPEFRFWFCEMAPCDLKIVLSTHKIAAPGTRAGTKNAGGGVIGSGNEVGGERIDGREGLIAREQICCPS